MTKLARLCKCDIEERLVEKYQIYYKDSEMLRAMTGLVLKGHGI